jgi:L-ascorbate metabolism protein UlaG (beta-lactamase superfamily)
LPRRLLLKNTRLSRIGFAGVRVEYGDLAICIDPGSEAPDCQVVLCTHNHSRHCGSWIQSTSKPIYSPSTGYVVKPGVDLNVNSVRVLVRDAYNDPDLYSGKPPHPRGFGVGYILIPPSGLTIYHTGDTSLVSEVLNPGLNIDVLVAPVGGGSVMTPEDAVELVKSIKPSITIPIHAEEIDLYYRFRDMAQPYTQVILL